MNRTELGRGASWAAGERLWGVLKKSTSMGHENKLCFKKQTSKHMFSPAKHQLSKLFIISAKATFRDSFQIERVPCVQLCSSQEQRQPFPGDQTQQTRGTERMKSGKTKRAIIRLRVCSCQLRTHQKGVDCSMV